MSMTIHGDMGIILSKPQNVHDDISTSMMIHGDMGIILSKLQMSMMIHILPEYIQEYSESILTVHNSTW